MRRHEHRAWLGGIVMAAAIAGGCAADRPIAAQEPPRPAKFRYDTRSPNNRIVFSGDTARAVFDIYSDNGIGTAGVELVEGDWPPAVTIRLHTKLLEKFDLESPTGQRAGLEVSSYARNEQRQTAADRGPDHPLFLTAKIVDYRTAPDLPRLPIRDPDGYFEIDVPAAMLADRPAWLKITWIDAYRG